MRKTNGGDIRSKPLILGPWGLLNIFWMNWILEPRRLIHIYRLFKIPVPPVDGWAMILTR